MLLLAAVTRSFSPAEGCRSQPLNGPCQDRPGNRPNPRRWSPRSGRTEAGQVERLGPVADWSRRGTGTGGVSATTTPGEIALADSFQVLAHARRACDHRGSLAQTALNTSDSGASVPRPVDPHPQPTPRPNPEAPQNRGSPGCWYRQGSGAQAVAPTQHKKHSAVTILRRCVSIEQ